MSLIASRVLRNALDIEAYANGVGAKMYESLYTALADVKKRLANMGDASFTRTHLEATQAQLEYLLNSSRSQRERLIMEASGEVVDTSYGSTARALSQEVAETIHGFKSRIPIETVEKIVDGPLGGHHLSTWVNRLDADVLGKARQVMVNAMTAGDGLDAVAKQLRDVAGLARHESRLLARTVFADASDRAENQVYQDNADVITGFKLLATLDVSTCLVCASYETGEVYESRDELPSVPIHPQCRCRVVALTKYSQAGLRPAVTEEKWKTVRHKDGTTSQKRVSLESKQVSGNTTFEQFFDRQPKSWQESYLGQGKYELYKSGKIDFSDLVNNRDRVLTLDELRKNTEN